MFHPIFDSFVFLSFAVLLLLGVAWQTAPRRNGRKAWGLVLLRWTTLLLLMAILARPSVSTVETEVFPGAVFILVDSSESMAVKDEILPGKPADVSPDESANSEKRISRYSAMEQTLNASSKELAAMARTIQTEVFSFDNALQSLPVTASGKISFPPKPLGERTALGNALLEVLQNSSGRKVLGVVLLSDGAQRSLPPQDVLPQTAARRFNQLGIPLYSVCFGSDQQKNQAIDAAVEDFIVEQRVFVDTEVAVTGRIRLNGFAGREIPVELLTENASGKMEIAAQTIIRAENHSETLPILLSWIPKELGEMKLSLRVPTQENEASTTNNQLDAFVTIVKSNLRVLYLEGAYRPETAFLRRALDSAEEIQLDLIRLDHSEKEFLNSSSSQRPDLHKILQEEYAAIILGDVSFTDFKNNELSILAKKISDGTGLLTLGGLQNYGPGGFANSPLAPMLPVLLAPNSPGPKSENADLPNVASVVPNAPGAKSQIVDSEIADSENAESDAFQKAHWNQPVQMKLTPAGKRHQALALDSDETRSAQLWGKLPALDGANRFSGWKSGAVVLLSDFTQNNQEIPLLLEQNHGKGRVMSLAVDSTWRWQMAGFDEQHKRFWRQLIFWIANRETTLDGAVSLILPQRRFPQEQTIEFQVSARLSNGETIPPPSQNDEMESWQAVLKDPDGKIMELPLVPSQDLMTGKIPSNLPVGDYTLSATVAHQNQKIGENQCRFQIFHHDLEMDRAQAEPQLMASLARSTGGETIVPDDLGKLWKKLTESRDELKIEKIIEIPVWDRWPCFIVLFSCLVVEWIVRKR